MRLGVTVKNGSAASSRGRSEHGRGEANETSGRSHGSGRIGGRYPGTRGAATRITLAGRQQEDG